MNAPGDGPRPEMALGAQPATGRYAELIANPAAFMLRARRDCEFPPT